MYINSNHSAVGAYGRMGMGSTIDAYGRTGGKSVKTPPDGQQADRAAARFELPENTRGQVRAPAAAPQNSRDTVTIGSYLRIETTVTYRARLNISAAPTAAPVEETAGTAAATDRGANSAAVMNAVRDNMNWVQNAAKDQTSAMKSNRWDFWSCDGETMRFEQLGIPGKGPAGFGELGSYMINQVGSYMVGYDGTIVGYVMPQSGSVGDLVRNLGKKIGDVDQTQSFETKVSWREEFDNWCVEHGGYEKAREFAIDSNFMKWLTSTLEKHGIKLKENETFGLSVDKYCKVTVTGDNKEKAAAIEKVLNSVPDGENVGLWLNRNTITNKDDFAPQMFKMLMSNYIEGASGGAVTLDDLYVENGKIMGLPLELDEFINSIEADPYFDAKRVDELYREQMSDRLKQALRDNPSLPSPPSLNNFIEDHPNQKSYDLKTVLAELLTTGVKNIPDLTSKVVIGNGSLAWC